MERTPERADQWRGREEGRGGVVEAAGVVSGIMQLAGRVPEGGDPPVRLSRARRPRTPFRLRAASLMTPPSTHLSIWSSPVRSSCTCVSVYSRPCLSPCLSAGVCFNVWLPFCPPASMSSFTGRLTCFVPPVPRSCLLICLVLRVSACRCVCTYVSVCLYNSLSRFSNLYLVPP